MIKNKKAVAIVSEAFLLLILVFYASIIAFLGIINYDNYTATVAATPEIDLGLFSVPSFMFGTFIDNIKALGWANAIIFGPLIIILLYYVAKLIRGTS